jgi:putative oxidoreductase
MQDAARFTPTLPYLIAAIAGVFILFGLWTPMAGVAVAAVEIWILFAGAETPLIAITLASLAGTLAMIGPGVWSIDAHLYGRKHIDPSLDY